MRDALIKAGIAEGTTTYDLLMAAAKKAVGSGLGGAQGAAAAFNADANNRQLHLHELRWIKANAQALAERMTALIGRPVSAEEAAYWAAQAGGSLVDTAAMRSSQFIRGVNISEEARLYDEAKIFINMYSKSSFVDERGLTVQLFDAPASDRNNALLYSDLRNSQEYRELMWQLTGQNLRPDLPTESDLSIYNARQRLVLEQTAKDLMLAAVSGGVNFQAVRLLNRLSAQRSQTPAAIQTISLSELDVVVAEHGSKGLGGGSGGHTGISATREAVLSIIQQTQPTSSSVRVAGAGAEGPDFWFTSVRDGSTVQTVQLKTAASPRAFEGQVKRDLEKQVGAGGSNVIAVVYPDAAQADRLLGKLRAMNPRATAGRSIVVVDPMGRVIIPLQPWPGKP